jgi:hypothetical protein
MFSYRKELERQKRILQLIKENGCDMCIDDLLNGRITLEDLEKEDYQKIATTKMGFERIYLCKNHLFQLNKELKEAINKNSITNSSSNQTTTQNNKRMLPIPVYKKEIEKTKEEIESNLILRRLFKVDCCSRCLTEAPCSRDCDSPERAPVYRLYLGGRRILLCKNHLLEFSESIEKFISENYPEETITIKR